MLSRSDRDDSKTSWIYQKPKSYVVSATELHVFSSKSRIRLLLAWRTSSVAMGERGRV